MEAFFSSTLAMIIAEMGDKTQFLALFLAAKFPQKSAIVFGIFMATLLNHALSVMIGIALAQYVSPDLMKWFVGLSFMAVGLWLLLPSKDDKLDKRWLKYGAFGATALLFFMAEIGDKTQIATILLAAKYQEMFWVICGSLLASMVVNAPVIYLGNTLIKAVPMKFIRLTACIVFCVLGVATLLGHQFSSL